MRATVLVAALGLAVCACSLPAVTATTGAGPLATPATGSAATPISPPATSPTRAAALAPSATQLTAVPTPTPQRPSPTAIPAPPSAIPTVACAVTVRFALLRAAYGAVGACTEDERATAGGDIVQRTTAGLLVWRRADNVTAFTNGDRTWLLGPQGLQERANAECFAWEASCARPVAPTPTPTPTLTPWPTTGVRLHRADGLPVWVAVGATRRELEDNYHDASYGDKPTCTARSCSARSRDAEIADLSELARAGRIVLLEDRTLVADTGRFSSLQPVHVFILEGPHAGTRGWTRYDFGKWG